MAAPGPPRRVRVGLPALCALSARWGVRCGAPQRTALRAQRRLSRLAGGEVGPRAERAVERRPRLPVAQLLLEPVERAQAAAEVVAEVHERRLAGARDHGRPVLERAVV